MKPNFRHSDNCEKITIYDLIEGDFVWVQGYLFEASDITINERVLRYTGNVVPGVDGNEHILRTAFDGGRYGHNDSDKCTIVKRHLH